MWFAQTLYWTTLRKHITLMIHNQSGAWILEAVESFYHSEYIAKGAHTALSYICSFKYWVEFSIDNSEKEAVYISRRNERLLGSGMGPRVPPISGIPFTQDITLQTAVFRQGLNSGGFACVFQGFHPENGELRAIKRLNVKQKAEHIEIGIRGTAAEDPVEGRVTSSSYWATASSSSNEIQENQQPYVISQTSGSSLNISDLTLRNRQTDSDYRCYQNTSDIGYGRMLPEA